jgi:hypothetical protein
VQEGRILVEQLLSSNSHDSRLDQLQEIIGFLESIIKKSPTDMQQDGVATLDDYLDDAVQPEMAQKIKQDVDMIAKIKNAAPNTGSPVVQASGSDNWTDDRDKDGKPKTPEVVEVPRLAGKKEAGDVIQMPAKKTPKPEADINQLSSDTLAKMQKALAGSEDLMNDKAAQAFIAAIAQTLMNRPVEVEQEAAPAAPAAGAPAPAAAPPAPAQVPIAASVLGGLSIVADEEGNTKVATSQGGSWFVTNQETGKIEEDGGRTPEIAEAHSKLEDNTGIKRPATELPSKFAAGDMTTGKAVKIVDKLGDELKRLYFEAKPVTEVLDSRPVREAVEAIYRAYDLMGEAAKVLNKQHIQEQAEEKAIEVKEKNNKKSSVLFSLSLVGEE